MDFLEKLKKELGLSRTPEEKAVRWAAKLVWDKVRNQRNLQPDKTFETKGMVIKIVELERNQDVDLLSGFKYLEALGWIKLTKNEEDYVLTKLGYERLSQNP